MTGHGGAGITGDSTPPANFGVVPAAALSDLPIQLGNGSGGGPLHNVAPVSNVVPDPGCQCTGSEEPMLEVYQYQANGQPLQQWETYYHYDAAGRVDRVGNQSAITPGTVTVGQTTYRGYNDTFADLVDQNTAGDDYWLSTSAGLVEIRDYDTSVSPGYITANKVHQGWTYPAETNAITVNTTQYTSHQADSSFGGGTVYPMASSTEYRNTDGTGAEPGKGTQFVSGVCNSRNELRALFHPANRRRSVTATREVELPNPQQRKGYGP